MQPNIDPNRPFESPQPMAPIRPASPRANPYISRTMSPRLASQMRTQPSEGPIVWANTIPNWNPYIATVRSPSRQLSPRMPTTTPPVPVYSLSLSPPNIVKKKRADWMAANPGQPVPWAT